MEAGRDPLRDRPGAGRRQVGGGQGGDGALEFADARGLRRPHGGQRQVLPGLRVLPAHASSCNSYVGRIGGEQAVNIPTWCTTGSIIHEVGHAVGLWHEQSRPDRDSNVKIDLTPVKESSRHNFAKRDDGTFDTAYDFGSIMHYGPKAFSGNGADTITPLKPLPPGTVMGQREGLSEGDIQAVAAMYR
ncbi:M12 family metallopeptidase [Kitasatospora sp. NPDC048540]|uniref:M12 family metallopeptidase n=1 Tax=Kitasatospora sp. NPDC048540 TaxID=3155634 RepID=UPI0009E86F19